MGDTNRVDVFGVTEATWGATPATPAFQTLRIQSESLTYAISKQIGKELDSSRNIKNVYPVSANASGDISGEFSATTWDAYIASALSGAWATNVLKNGTTNSSFSLLRKHADVTQYFLYTGMNVSQWDLTISAKSPVTTKFAFMGKTNTISATPPTGATFLPKTTTPIITSGASIGSILEGGSAMTGAVIQSIVLTVKNNIREINAIDQFQAAALGYGFVEVSGSMKVLFANSTLYNKFLASTASSLAFTLTDTSVTPKSYAILIPNLQYDADKINASGQNADIFEDITFKAAYDTTTAASIQITRVP